MIDFEKILRKTREENSWVIEMYIPSDLHRRFTLSEPSLTNHLANYSHMILNVNAFLAWGNDPRRVDLNNLPDVPKITDDRIFLPVTRFSEYYLDHVPIDFPIISTPRLEKFVKDLDQKVIEFNAVMPAIKHPNSDRDFISRKFMDFASKVLVYEKDINDAIKDASIGIDLIYAYKSGTIFVTSPNNYDQIPRDKRHLFGL